MFSDGLHHSAARIELGDLRLDKEISNRFGLNYNATFNKLDIKTDLFLNHINLMFNIIYRVLNCSGFTNLFTSSLRCAIILSIVIPSLPMVLATALSSGVLISFAYSGVA